MKKASADADIFISAFRADKGSREQLVLDLIQDAGRLTLNMPRHGLARIIADRLKEGPFSDYYEFEKHLARALHPLMAGCNLNVVSDLQVNRLFSERFNAYDRELNMVLASGRKLAPQSLRKLIVSMAAEEGHYMVVKFYDLVLRGIDLDLYKTLKPVEEALIRMKYSLGEDEERNRLHVGKTFREFRDRKDADAAKLLLMRMEWDDAMRSHVALLGEEGEADGYDGVSPASHGEQVEEDAMADWSGASSLEDDGSVEPEASRGQGPTGGHDRIITGYARLIKNQYLDAVDPRDGERVRGIIEGIYLKNETVYDSQRAADVVREVLGIWIADEALDHDKRRILEEIADEERFLPSAVEHAEYDDIIAGEMIDGESSRDEGDDRADATLEDASLVREMTPEEAMDAPDDRRVSGDEAGSFLADAMDETPSESETVIAGTGNDSVDGGVSGIEMESLLDDILEEPAGDSVEGAQGVNVEEGVGVSGAGIEDMLNDASGEIPGGELETAPGDEQQASGEPVVTEGELDELLAGFPDEAAVEKDETAPPIDGGAEEFEPVLQQDVNMGPDSFVVKDEILFEDPSLVKKAPVYRKKPSRVRVSIRDIADTESRKNLLDLVELLAKTDTAADVSRYLVGAGVAPAVKYGVNDLVACTEFEEAFDRITGSELFDYNDKIIILEKWLKATGKKRGWFDPPHEDNLDKITGVIESYASELQDLSGGSDNEYLLDDGSVSPGAGEGDDPGYDGEAMSGGMQEKEIIKTGDDSIRISHDLNEFRELYGSGVDDAAVAERLPRIQGLFDRLAGGEEPAVHFAVYHKQDFADFIRFIDENPGLREMLDTERAIRYCRKKKIL